MARLATEQAREETALVRLRSFDLRRGMVTSAPLGGGNTPLHHLHVFATTGPRRLTAGPTLHRSAHPTLLLLASRYPRGYKKYTPLGIPVVNSEGVNGQ